MSVHPAREGLHWRFASSDKLLDVGKCLIEGLALEVGGSLEAVRVGTKRRRPAGGLIECLDRLRDCLKGGSRIAPGRRSGGKLLRA